MTPPTWKVSNEPHGEPGTKAPSPLISMETTSKRKIGRTKQMLNHADSVNIQRRKRLIRRNQNGTWDGCRSSLVGSEVTKFPPEDSGVHPDQIVIQVERGKPLGLSGESRSNPTVRKGSLLRRQRKSEKANAFL